MNNVEWLQHWYMSKCDGDWEHGFGPRISTIDNPGWTVRIPLDARDHVPANMKISREGEQDWFDCSTSETEFVGVGGAQNLNDLLNTFRGWIEPNSKKETK